MLGLFSCNQLQNVVSLGLWPHRIRFGTVSPLLGRRALDKRAYYSMQERTSGAPDASMWNGGEMDLRSRLNLPRSTSEENLLEKVA
jgi:hypothetical protein